MLSIIIWKVAGELVNPKNMTIGSKSPLLVFEGGLVLIAFLNTNVEFGE